MPSSTSSSDPYSYEDRPIPRNGWGKAALLAGALALLLAAVWEAGARYHGYDTWYVDTPGLWALERKQLDTVGNDAVAFIGSSRTLFDMDLAHWREATGRETIQLAVVGTSPRLFLEEIATKTDFAGLVMVGVTPPLFFTERGGFQEFVLDYYRDESPSEKIGQWLAMRLETRLAFLERDNLPLPEILENQAWWPESREGVYDPYWQVWKLEVVGPGRDTRLWDRVVYDQAYRDKATETWSRFLLERRDMPPPPPADEAIADVRPFIEKIRARGGEVAFIRLPSNGPFREAENRGFPREQYWDRLIAETGSVGIHFEDYPQLQSYVIPEWSHLRADEAERYTRTLIPILDSELRARGSSGILLAGESR